MHSSSPAFALSSRCLRSNAFWPGLFPPIWFSFFPCFPPLLFSSKRSFRFFLHTRDVPPRLRTPLEHYTTLRLPDFSPPFSHPPPPPSTIRHPFLYPFNRPSRFSLAKTPLPQSPLLFPECTRFSPESFSPLDLFLFPYLVPGKASFFFCPSFKLHSPRCPVDQVFLQPENPFLLFFPSARC